MKIKLVTGDTPLIPISITDPATGLAIDLTASSILLKVRKLGGTLKASVPCSLLPGLVLKDDSINYAPPYDVAGKGGRCLAECDATVFDAAGEYEAEVEVTTGPVIITTFKIHKFTVREDL